MDAVHTHYESAEVLDFPGEITLRVLLSGSQTNGTHAVFEDVVQPGVGPGRHIHHHQDETFLFLEGTFHVEIGGVRHEVSPGDVAFVPRGTVHAFRNVGDTVGVLRYVFSPALTVEEMFRAFHAAQDGGELSLDEMAKLALEYGQEFVGPRIELPEAGE